MGTLATIALLVISTTECFGSVIITATYVNDSAVTQLYCVYVRSQMSPAGCAVEVSRNLVYRYGLAMDGDACIGCRMEDSGWSHSSDEIVWTSPLLVLGMYRLYKTFCKIFRSKLETCIFTNTRSLCGYRHISNIRRTKCQNLNVSRLVLQLS